jgi:hypothetical protein
MSMIDYEPVDLSAFYNVGVEVLGENAKPAIEEQTFRGLPFQIGDDKAAFIALHGTDTAVTIPVGKPIKTLVVAHRLLDSQIIEDGLVGAPVADYEFKLDGDRQIVVPIRERFEIAVIDFKANAGRPYRAVPDKKDFLYSRKEGDWDLTGRRQTEAGLADPKDYFLWIWVNPEPGSVLESLRIVPKGPRFIVAAVTAGYLEEYPIARHGRRPARILIKDPVDAEKPFDIDVEVDRGVSTYAHQLPRSSPEEFMDDHFVGWGEVQNDKSSPSYVEVSATPSATVTVKQGGEDVGSVIWGEVEDAGEAEDERVRIELIDPGKNWVYVTVLDDDTGKPVPCRVHFRSPDGVPYQPHGYHNHVNSNMDTWHIDVGGDMRLGQITYAYIDGTCQGWLPRGDMIAEVVRGFEYDPVRTQVRIAPGQQELTLRIKRWTDMNDQGWYSGDSHVHFLSTQGSHTESLGEDLNVVNLLQSQWGSLFTNREDFTGAPSVSQLGDSIVYVSQENRQHFLGHMILWGLKKPVMPWCSDGLSEAEIGGTMETTLSHWADEAHAQGGYVINPHFPSPNGEPAALAATGRLDGVEMIRMADYNHREYYRYLNCGYRLPLVGGTDKMSSDVPVGLYRTYAYIGNDQEFTYDNWCKAVTKGRTFLSGGPIIHFSVDGHQVGDTIELSGSGTVEVQIWAESTLPIHVLELVQEGKVIASAESKDGSRRLSLNQSVMIEGHTWLAARCGGPSYYGTEHHDVWKRGMFAHTSPIYVSCGGQWDMFDMATAQYMLTMIEGDLTYIRETSGQHMHGNVTHHHGEDDHMAFLERPFIEAQKAIHARMHNLGISH